MFGMFIHLDTIWAKFKVKVIGESSRSHVENVAEVVGATSSEGFLVCCRIWVRYTSIFSSVEVIFVFTVCFSVCGLSLADHFQRSS